MSEKTSKGPFPEINVFIAETLKDRGLSPEGFACRPIPGDGSKRAFWRIVPDRSPDSFIAMENVPSDDFSRRENEAYLRIGMHLFKKGLPLPEIHRYDLKRGWFLMEDLGETSLQDWASRNRDRLVMYERVVEVLFRLQSEGAEGFDTAWTCQTKSYDPMVMRRYESDYFRDAYLRGYLGLKDKWPELEGPFDYLVEKASMAESRFFLHRDFQSRNIMVGRDRIGIIDWQGGRMGPLAYDLASLLIDPYTVLSAEERKAVYEAYLACLRRGAPGMEDAFRRDYPYLAVQRNLQILGAFAYLTRVRGKAYFAAYIPRALHSLSGLLLDLKDPRLSPLKALARSLLDSA